MIYNGETFRGFFEGYQMSVVWVVTSDGPISLCVLHAAARMVGN